jgi:hypothetical protein
MLSHRILVVSPCSFLLSLPAMSTANRMITDVSSSHRQGQTVLSSLLDGQTAGFFKCDSIGRTFSHSGRGFLGCAGKRLKMDLGEQASMPGTPAVW